MRFFHDTSRQAVKTASLTRHSFHASRELIRLRASKSGGTRVASVSLSTKLSTKKKVILENKFVPLAARISDESAGLRRKRRALDLRPPAAPPACRSVQAHAPPEKVSLASSMHPSTSGPRFLKKALQDMQAHST